MSKFNVLRVSKVNRETADAVSVSFDIPETLQQAYQYIPGQYLTLKLQINGEQLNRSYSFCSSAAAGEPMTIAVKKVTGGRASTFINSQFREGLEVEVMEPMGNFHSPIDETQAKNYFLFGGGSGITPLFSILKTVLIKEPKSTVTLFYGNRDTQSIIFRKQLNEWEAKYEGRLKVVHILDKDEVGWQGYTGFIVKDMALRLLRENTDLNFRHAEFFICGPVAMMKEVETALHALDIPKNWIHIEYFTEKADEDKQAAGVGNVADTEPPFTGKTKVKLIYDGNEVEFEVTEKETILHAALDAGYDPPYSCMVAACCTCRAKLVSGKVEMDDRESLTDAEISKGYVLTCQSHPKSNGIVLNYDI
ncbi:MAG: 2Fe-2S iron-sulfur cluster-binding protein [Chitinophagales bacterium]